MDHFQPPLPQRPDLESKPKASPLWWLIVGFSGLMLLAVVAFLATPVLWVAFAIALVIGLQYVLWGWWFERIYRSGPVEEASAAINPTPPTNPIDPLR
jgi:Flp pilus assembly protein TadB